MQARRSVQHILDAVARRASVRSVLLVNEVGLYLAAGREPANDPELVAHATIALHGAAASALGNPAARRLRVVAEAGLQRILALGVGEGLVLVALVEAEAPLMGELVMMDAAGAALESELAVTAEELGKPHPRGRTTA